MSKCVIVELMFLLWCAYPLFKSAETTMDGRHRYNISQYPLLLENPISREYGFFIRQSFPIVLFLFLFCSPIKRRVFDVYLWVNGFYISLSGLSEELERRCRSWFLLFAVLFVARDGNVAIAEEANGFHRTVQINLLLSTYSALQQPFTLKHGFNTKPKDCWCWRHRYSSQFSVQISPQIR